MMLKAKATLNPCGVKSWDGWHVCQRPAGHSGAHVDNRYRVIAGWPNNNKEGR